jgi:hypothetical protein
MRIIMHVSFATDVFNAAVKDGTAAAKMQRILGKQKPEAAYFTDRNGERSGILVVHMKDNSEIPSFAEPWFLTFNAKIEMHPAMTVEDLGVSGMEALGKEWG